jgi:hypothetical protein
MGINLLLSKADLITPGERCDKKEATWPSWDLSLYSSVLQLKSLAFTNRVLTVDEMLT